MTGPFTSPEPLRSDHDVQPFSCGKPDLDAWLRDRALKAEGRSARTYVVCRDKAVIGFYALATGASSQSALPGRLRRNMPDPVPILVLARLAVDARCHKQGLGGFLLRDALLRAVAAHRAVGFRALVVHAKDDEAAAFYGRFGFIPFPAGARTLFLPIETLIAAL